MNFKTVTSKVQNAEIRMLKCYLASDQRGHFVTTNEAANMLGQVWSCVSCGCRLIFHTGTHADSPWFEHDQATVAASTLMSRAHIDPVVSLVWYCVWCANHYSWEKRCTACGTGIYSIEESSWQNNYT